MTSAALAAPVTITLAWWGNDTRNQITNDLIAEFEKAHPDIKVEPQEADWGGYWDLVATQTAAGNTPDILQMDITYIATYARNGIIADLTKLQGFDMSQFPASSLGPGTLNGAVYGVPAGQNTNMIVVNPDLLAKAGLEMPDDRTWTWDDLAKMSAQVSDAGKGQFYGYEDWGYDGTELIYWLRDHGDDLYDAKGNVIVKPETLTSYWQFGADMEKSGAMPPPSVLSEAEVAGLSSSLMATNKVAFGDWSSNQLKALREASGTHLELLRFPTTTPGAQFFLPSMFWSASAHTAHPKEVAMLLNFLLNSETAADHLLTERGVPVNAAIRTYLAPKLDEAGQDTIKFVDDLSKDVGAPEPIIPAGASIADDVMRRYTEQVLFGTMSPADAAKGFIQELTDAVNAAK
jgi:multiple sugar transport system substrate-binding protein